VGGAVSRAPQKNFQKVWSPVYTEVGVQGMADFIYRGMRFRQTTSAPVRYIEIHPALVYDLLAQSEEPIKWVDESSPMPKLFGVAEFVASSCEHIQARQPKRECN
jgi:hypothetical protein